MKKLYYTVYKNLDNMTKHIKVYSIKGDILIEELSFHLNSDDMSRQEIYNRVGSDNVSSLTLI